MPVTAQAPGSSIPSVPRVSQWEDGEETGNLHDVDVSGHQREHAGGETNASLTQTRAASAATESSLHGMAIIGVDNRARAERQPLNDGNEATSDLMDVQPVSVPGSTSASSLPEGWQGEGSASMFDDALVGATGACMPGVEGHNPRSHTLTLHVPPLHP